jgi:integrase/recombinase XerC
VPFGPCSLSLLLWKIERICYDNTNNAADNPRGSAIGLRPLLGGQQPEPVTIVNYTIDLTQFMAFLAETNPLLISPTDVIKSDISEYMASLSDRKLSGVARARKLAAIRAFFRFLVEHDHIPSSPAEGLPTPKKEKNERTHLTSAEYTKILSLAGGNPRDYAMFQIFLQTGIRVSELCNLAVSDLDLTGGWLHVREGKGQKARRIELEPKGIQAVKSYLKLQGASPYPNLFLNYKGDPISERGVEKIVTKYAKRAGITRRVMCHSLRHTFATEKAKHPNVSIYQLQKWLGHENIQTTQIYVHLARQDARKIMAETSL